MTRTQLWRRSRKDLIFRRGVAAVDPALSDDTDDSISSDDDSDDELSVDESADDDSPTTSTFSQVKSSSSTTTATSIASHAGTAEPQTTTSSLPGSAVASSSFASATSAQGLATVTISTSTPPVSIVTSSFVSASSELQSATTTGTPVTTSTSTAAINTPQAESSSAGADDPVHIHNIGRNSSRNAGVIAAATIGSIAVLALILFMFWRYRRGSRRANDSDQSRAESWQPNGPETAPASGQTSTKRSPSSIMNYLMRAAYAAEDGMGYNGNASDEKSAAGFYANKHESTERLTFPPGAQLRHPSVSARTETSNATEGTWRTWGASGALHDLEGKGWTRRFF
ncbi:hypothetical protein GGR57DRAFT_185846 [Xylariaceae sp. FL1272]|nr:hypothetical protein GGR57DRAFT_185846 [Xylariaceae sp. FL1272]